MTHKGTVTLETERLILRKFAIDDLEPFFTNCLSDADVWKWTRYPPMRCSGDVMRAGLFTEKWLSAYKQKNRYSWAITLRQSGEVIGRHGCRFPDDELRQIELTYELGKRWWNRGYMTEATGRIIDFYFREVGFNRVFAVHADANPASGKVMRKCGMKREGVLRQAHKCNNGIFDEIVYAVLAGDFFAGAQV